MKRKDDNPQYEIDYNTIIKSYQEKINKLIAEHDEYFKLQQFIGSDRQSLGTVVKNIYRMKLPDQLLILRATAYQLQIAQELCKKYGFYHSEDEEE